MSRPTDQEAADHAEQALKLRIQGKSYRAIAREMGLSKAAVEKAIKKALGENIPDPPEHLRALEAERLDALLGGLWPMAMAQNGEDPWEDDADLKGLSPSDDEVISQKKKRDAWRKKYQPKEVNLFAVDRVLKIQAQRAVLLGLNKPVIVEDDLGDQLAATLKRVSERYKALGASSTDGDADPQDA